MAPEVQIDKKCSRISDIFSFGMTICCIYNRGQSLINAEHSPQQYLKQLEQVCYMTGKETLFIQKTTFNQGS